MDINSSIDAPNIAQVIQEQPSLAVRREAPELSNQQNTDAGNDTSVEEKQITSLRDLHGIINNFSNPAEMLIFYDKSLIDGSYSLHKWQAEELLEFAKFDASSANPYELALCAVNGSGKDKFFIAGALVWTIFTKLDSYWVQTSSSALQLESQTETYVRRLCESINLYHGMQIFSIKEKHIKCNITDGECLLFRSDEESKTEGHHPRKPGAVFVICINEAKSVEDKIFEALLRCNGYTHWLEISSPGKPDGHFFRYFTSSRSGIRQRRITVFDCSHLGEHHINRIKHDIGENTPLYRSIVFAEFTSEEDTVVLSYYKYNRCLKFPPSPCGLNDICLGLDLSGGGDESSMTLRRGNQIAERADCRISDLKMRAQWITDNLEKWSMSYSFDPKKVRINADAGGLGAEVIKYMHILGYRNIRGYFNNSPSDQPELYKSLGTQMWFKFSKLVEEQEVILHDEEILRKQLCNRFYSWANKNNTTIAFLEPKPQAKAKGHPSPDRADSVVLAFHEYVPQSVILNVEKEKKRKEEEKANRGYNDGNTIRSSSLIPPTIDLLTKSQNGSVTLPTVERMKKSVSSDLKMEVNSINERLKQYYANKNN